MLIENKARPADGHESIVMAGKGTEVVLVNAGMLG
jgi:hypothetical protein